MIGRSFSVSSALPGDFAGARSAANAKGVTLISVGEPATVTDEFAGVVQSTWNFHILRLPVVHISVT